MSTEKNVKEIVDSHQCVDYNQLFFIFENFFADASVQQRCQELEF